MSDDDQEEKKPRESRDDRRQRLIETKIARISEFRGMTEDVEDLVGYIYRETEDGSRQTAGRISEIMLDHEFGVLLGPGKYHVTYHWKDDNDKARMLTEKYNIGPEYGPLYIESCRNSGKQPLRDFQPSSRPQGFQLSDLMSEDKIKGLLAMLGALKMVFSNGSSGGEVETLKAVLAGNTQLLASVLGSKNQASSMMPPELLTLLFDRATKKEPPALPAQDPISAFKGQLDIFKEIKSMTEPPPPERVEPMTATDKIIEKAMDFLPAVLAKFGGNETAAASELKRKNLIVKHYLKNPEIRTGLYRKIAAENGTESADRWAKGFGIPIPGKAIPTPGVINFGDKK